MPENDNTNPPVEDDSTGTNPPAGGEPEKDIAYWQAEAEKWTVLSRKHEDREKKLLKENADLKNASMSDAEKAIAEARKEGEVSGLKKGAEAVVRANLRAVAAEKGKTLPDLDALNLSKFATDEGDADEQAIESFVDSLGGSKKRFADAKDLGIGRQGGSGKPEQYTVDRIRNMSHADRVKAREDGHLNDLLGIEQE